MKHLVKNFSQFNKRQDPVVFWATATSLFGIAITLLILVVYYNDLPSQLPLFYSLAWGEGQLVPISQIVILPALTIVITLINLLFSWHLHTSQQVLKRMLSLFSASLSIILSLAAIRIIFLFL